MERALTQPVRACHWDDRTDCPIIEGLAGERRSAPPTTKRNDR